MCNLSLLLLSLSSLLLYFLCLGLFELIEVAFIVVEFLTLELNDFINDLVQEVTSVRDNDHRNI